MTLGVSGVDPGALQQKMLETAQKIGQEQGAAPNGSDVQRFQAALEGGSNPAPAGGAAPVDTAGGAAATPSVPPSSGGMGDRILQGMSEISQKIQSGREVAVQALGSENVTQADLLRANFGMIESNTLVSAVSKTTEKITQGLKTLQQG